MKFLCRLGRVIQTAFMAVMTVFITGFLLFVGFGSYWAVNILDERFFGQGVDLGGGATGRVVKIATWWTSRHVRSELFASSRRHRFGFN
jgi:hypothetical protein